MKVKVLFIDDERNNLTAFKASFRREYDVYIANSVAEGFEILEKEEIHVLFTDQRMPGVTGVQFLEQLTEKYPEPMRVLITGYADIDAVIDAINKGQVFRYISKPWKDEEIRAVIEEAFKIYMDRRERNFFVYKASHDLKGPLVSIKGLVNIVKREMVDNNEINQYVDLIDESVNHLDDTLSELIEFKKIGESSLIYEQVDFEFLIQKILMSLQNIENFEKNSFTIHIEEGKVFSTDRSLMKSVFTNVIQNAVKYGRYNNNNVPEVQITIKFEDKHGVFEIRDNGMGMSEEVQKNIFRMFYRGTSEVKGTGLGMYIVKTAIDKLGGKIEVDSTSGSGTIFRFIIPEAVLEPA